MPQRPRIKILFVCHGNICRSPAAECVFAALVQRRGVQAAVEIDSAGVSSEHGGESPYPDTQAVLRRRGYEVFGRSRPVTKADASHFDFIVCMDRQNQSALLARGFPASRVSLLRSHDPAAQHDEVGDPWGYPEKFDGMMDVIEPACAALLSKLLQGVGQD